ncbi:MAG TPA: ribose 5-phosphate isomerase B [Saprospiraceae bacterium]|nr:ribose 5-phosphate isomerase B [Saprospiraceae bacterium]
MQTIISIGTDHAGVEYKNSIKAHLEQMGFAVLDHGTNSDESVDYPDFIHPVGEDLDANKAKFGIVICGSGNGAAITANKHRSVRCALCWNQELAVLAREHNDANVMSIPARYVSLPLAISMVDSFLNTAFAGGRHLRRVEKISC